MDNNRFQTASEASDSTTKRSSNGGGLSAVPPTVADRDWTIEDSLQLYGIREWGYGYFGVNSTGHVCVHPNGKGGPEIDLRDLVDDLQERGIRAPILMRFMDVVDARVKLVNECFAKAINEYGYKNHYQGVYPIKVNQRKHLVERIMEAGAGYNVGLECGSKPELLVALAMMKTGSKGLLVCNGFKDTEYIETALLSQKLGFNTIIVVEKSSDLDLILNVSERLQMRPRIGFRARLESKVSGKWAETSGPKSKFGLSSSDIVKCINKLKDYDKLSCVELLHFHIGSQIPNIQSIKSSIKEGARYYTELVGLGCNIKFVDVGGGLGVDYDGSGGGDSSINYSEQEYANDVVSIIQNVCEEKSVAHPTIVSESGRSLTAHHSLLIFNVLGTSGVSKNVEPEKAGKGDHLMVKELSEIYDNLSSKNLVEFYNDVLQARNDVSQLFSYGIITLEQRAKAENLINASMRKMVSLAQEANEEEILANLQGLLLETYYANFSVFQSVPDSWAVNQVFPVIPIHRLEQCPTKNAILVDLTCDCDGKMDQFIQSGEKASTIALHPFSTAEPYYLGVFLVGAYQEILGDLHNLFGDTDAVSVSIDDTGYHILEVEEGDTVDEILGYIQYNRTDLIQRMRRSVEDSIKAEHMTKSDARLFMRNYEDGLAGYTYLEDPHF
ncbi:MAG: biosynthetic arginine decarboxylase [Bdellovibrionales bacterium]|nr:biosynthetic arginine decarboxylase [Bdellovibrionales bacterium]